MTYPIAFNVAKGCIAELAKLTGTNDALIAVPIEALDIATESTMKDYDTLAAILAGSSNEQTTMGRQTLTDVTITVDDVTDMKILRCDDIVWPLATGVDAGLCIICYDPDTTGGSDSDLIPLGAVTMAVSPAGGDITYVVNPAGLFNFI